MFLWRVSKKSEIELNLGEMLQILSIALFEKVSITEVLTKPMSNNQNSRFNNQMLLFKL